VNDPYDIRTDGESRGPDGVYLVWYSDRQLEIDRCDSLQEALESARRWDDSEYGSFDSIEGPVGVVPDSEVQAWIAAKDIARFKADRSAAEADQGTIHYSVEVRHPDGKRVGEWDSEKTLQAALEPVAEHGFSPDRVRIIEKTWRRSPFGGGQFDDGRVIKDWSDPIGPTDTEGGPKT
jgi:hypothetical protein